MLRVIVGALLAAVLMFGWGFAYWMVIPEVAPMAKETVVTLTLEQENELAEALKKLPADGTYLVPLPPSATPGEMMPSDDDMKAWTERHKSGPISMISLRKMGADPMAIQMYGYGFVHFLLVSLLAANLLNMAGLKSFLARLGFCLCLGIFAAVAVNAGNVVWMMLDWKFQTYSGIYHATVMLIGGLALALIVRPKMELD
jgi:hypothetical protein